MNKTAEEIIKKNDMGTISVATTLVTYIGKKKVLDISNSELLEELKFLGNILTDNYREHIVELAKDIAALDNNQLQKVMKYTSCKGNKSYER